MPFSKKHAIQQQGVNTVVEAGRTAQLAYVFSVTLYLFSLPLAGFYTGPAHQEAYGGALLLSGWLGMLYGHFSWLANPLYLWSVVVRKSNPRRSAMLALLAFGIALEFLLHRTIITDEGGGTKAIAGVGWGYLCWLLSFLSLCLSSLVRIDRQEKLRASILLALMCLTTICFGYSYYFSAGNHSSLVTQRDRQFLAMCKETGESFYAKPSSPISGIYFSEGGGAYFSKFFFGRYTESGGGIFSTRGQKRIPLTERRNDGQAPTAPYLRQEGGAGKEILVSDLRSNYFVMIDSSGDKLPRELGLGGRTVLVYEKGIEQPLAKMAYAYSRIDHRFCGKVQDDRFDEIDFVFRALGLTGLTPVSQ